MKFVYTFYEYLLSNYFEGAKKKMPMFIISLVLSIAFLGSNNFIISSTIFFLLMISSIKVIIATIRGYKEFVK